MSSKKLQFLLTRKLNNRSPILTLEDQITGRFSSLMCELYKLRNNHITFVLVKKITFTFAPIIPQPDRGEQFYMATNNPSTPKRKRRTPTFMTLTDIFSNNS